MFRKTINEKCIIHAKDRLDVNIKLMRYTDFKENTMLIQTIQFIWFSSNAYPTNTDVSFLEYKKIQRKDSERIIHRKEKYFIKNDLWYNDWKA